MSANLYWHPVEKTKKIIETSIPGTVTDQLDRVFGGQAPTLNETDISNLEVLALLRDDKDNPFAEIIDAIRKVGAIKITVEH